MASRPCQSENTTRDPETAHYLLCISTDAPGLCSVIVRLGRAARCDGLSLKQEGAHASTAAHKSLCAAVLLKEHPVRLRLQLLLLLRLLLLWLLLLRKRPLLWGLPLHALLLRSVELDVHLPDLQISMQTCSVTILHFTCLLTSMR